MRFAGALLVLVGFAGLVWGLPYDKKEEVARIGSLKMEVTEKRELRLPPLVCGFAILAGTALWMSAGRRDAGQAGTD